jgi:hypothetical protein
MLKSIKFYRSKANKVNFSSRVIKRLKRHCGAVRKRNFYIYRNAECNDAGKTRDPNSAWSYIRGI